VTSEHLEAPPRDTILAPLDLGGTLRDLVDRVETEAIRNTLARFGGNRRRAAEALGLSRPGLRYKLRRLGLEPASEP